MIERLTKVKFSNLDKIIFPKIDVTKAQLIQYYIQVAPMMLPFLKDRPLVLTRYPDGVDCEGFFMKDAPSGTPDWVKKVRFYSESAKRSLDYILCNDLDTLIWLANLAAIEIHVPMSRADDRETPDFAFFDIDPEPPAIFDDAISVALLLKEKLDTLGLRSYIKTSGKKGFHVLIPVIRGYTFKSVRAFVHAVGGYLAKESDIIVSEFVDTKTPNRIFIDYTQNSHGRTMACPYSLRATVDATVSVPLDWADLKKKIKPSRYTIQNVPSLNEDPWKDIFLNPQKLEAK
jgi:bifunctional non-homologous end joining protein LigD